MNINNNVQALVYLIYFYYLHTTEIWQILLMVELLIEPPLLDDATAVMEVATTNAAWCNYKLRVGCPSCFLPHVKCDSGRGEYFG